MIYKQVIKDWRMTDAFFEVMENSAIHVTSPVEMTNIYQCVTYPQPPPPISSLVNVHRGAVAHYSLQSNATLWIAQLWTGHKMSLKPINAMRSTHAGNPYDRVYREPAVSCIISILCTTLLVQNIGILRKIPASVYMMSHGPTMLR